MTSDESSRFELFSRDVNGTATFLQRLLGFSAIRTDDAYCELQLGTVVIGLGSIDALPNGHPLKAVEAERLGLGIES